MLVWVPHLRTCVRVRVCAYERIRTLAHLQSVGVLVTSGSVGALEIPCTQHHSLKSPTFIPHKSAQNIPKMCPKDSSIIISFLPEIPTPISTHFLPSPRTQVRKYTSWLLTCQPGTALTFLKCDVFCKHQAFESPWEELIWLQSMQSGMQNILRRGCFAEICILRGQFWPVLTRCILRRGEGEE